MTQENAEQQDAPKIKSATGSTLGTRVKSALILAPVVLILLYMGGTAYAAMMALIGAIATYEWTRMAMTGQASIPKGLAGLTAVLAAIAIFAADMDGVTPAVAFWFLAALSFLVFAYNFSQKGSASPRPLLTGMIYIVFASQVMVWIRNGTDNGLYNMLTLLCIVWASDICAYFAGRSLGGPKLAPAISPKKTWSGFIGSSVGAGFAAFGLAHPWMTQHLGVETIGGLASRGYFILGFVLAMFGQAGDLLISVFKRHFGVKDTGTLIPGHGGVLDRIDALLLVALIFGSIISLLGG